MGLPFGSHIVPPTPPPHNPSIPFSLPLSHHSHRSSPPTTSWSGTTAPHSRSPASTASRLTSARSKLYLISSLSATVPRTVLRLLPLPLYEALAWLCGGLSFFAALGLAAVVNDKASKMPYTPKVYPYDKSEGGAWR